MSSTKKKRKSQYTAEQKFDYHMARTNDLTLSKNKRIYSENWVRGFIDAHADNNLRAAQEEYNRNKKYMDSTGKAIYQGNINGLKTAVKDKEAAYKVRYHLAYDWRK
ncbi:MAG: hypothetical protein LUD27_02720 [Clostridia bacterium]|nr:hypothetical protein [Clostridia bacterium]